MKKMKTWKKRGMALLMCGALLMGTGTSYSSALAAETQSPESKMPTEVEDNSIQSKATPIELNKTYLGNTEKSDDVDWYKFVIPEGSKGYLNVILAPDTQADTDALKNGWQMGVYQDRAADSILTWNSITSRTETQNMPLVPGAYYIRIKPQNSASWTAENYNLCVKYTADDSWESEDIEDKPNQNVIDVNRTYFGNCTYGKDVDWYEFTLPEYGKLTIDMTPAQNVDTDSMKEGWNLKIYRANDADEFDQLQSVTSPQKTVDLFLNKGKYHIKISSQNAVLSPSGNATYEFRLNYTKGENVEHELNDTMGTANIIRTGITYTGNMNYESRNDKDYFAVTPATSGRLTVNFSRDLTSEPKDGFKVKVLDSNNNELAVAEKVTGQTKSVGPVSVRAGVKYYILIENHNSGFPIQGVNYHFSVSVKSTTTQVGKIPVVTATNNITKTSVKLTKAKGGKKKVTLKWKKNKYATGYKIYRSTKKKGKYKCIKKIKKAKTVSYTDKKVKKKKTYYYKVRAYKKNGKGLIYSKYSSVKRAKTK